MAPDSTLRQEPWWTPFRRPSTWIAIVGFAILDATVSSLGVPDLWATVVFGVLLAATVAIVTRARAPWLPLVIVLAVLTSRAVVRAGGWPAFLGFEGALLLLLLIGIVFQRRKTA